jgi:predicted acylesterase/phospholipase RssA
MLNPVASQSVSPSGSFLDSQVIHSSQEKTCQAVKIPWRNLAMSFALLGVLTALSLSVYLGSSVALASLALTALFFTFVFFVEKRRFSKPSSLSIVNGIYEHLQKNFSRSFNLANEASSSEKKSSFKSISLFPQIEDIVISGGGAKGAVLPGAFRALFKEAPDLIENTQHLFGSSVGALFAALIATGISKEDLKIIQQTDLSAILGKKLIYKDGEDLILFLRQWIRVNILSQLLNLSEENKQCFYERRPALAGEIMLHLLKTPLEEAYISFEMLAYLHEIDPRHFKLLSVTSTKKEGGQFIFDALLTPQADIAFACRASASLPIIFDPVRIVHDGEELTLFDGGLIDNVPVALVEQKKGKSAEQVNAKTLVFVFEKLRDAPSVFPLENLTTSHNAGFRSRLVKNELVPRLAGYTLPAPYTVLRSELLQKIKEQYRHVISFPVDLVTRDFHKASKNPKKYSRIGKKAVRNFLAQ